MYAFNYKHSFNLYIENPKKKNYSVEYGVEGGRTLQLASFLKLCLCCIIIYVYLICLTYFIFIFIFRIYNPQIGRLCGLNLRHPSLQLVGGSNLDRVKYNWQILKMLQLYALLSYLPGLFYRINWILSFPLVKYDSLISSKT